MPMYEVMFIVQPEVEGEALEGAISRVKEVIEKENGSIVSLKRIGKRKLAYEINDYREGFYVVATVQAGNRVVPALEHFFKVNEGYLRYIVIRLEGEEKKEQNVEALAESAQNAQQEQREE